jgi:general secretion pathway protein N
VTRYASSGQGLSRRARVWLTGLGLAGFLLALFLQLPAAVLLRFLPSPLPAPLATHPAGMSASGTVWNGELRGLQLARQPIESVQWELSPWAVLSGRLRGHAQALASGVRFETRFDLSLAGVGELSDLQGEFPLAWVQPAATHPWQGQVQLALDAVKLTPQGPAEMAGTLNVSGLSSPALAEPLGDYRLDWPAGAKQGRVSTLRGPVVFRAAMLPLAGGGFRLDGEATPEVGATPAVRQALGMFGLPDAQGRYQVRIEFGVSAPP